MYEEGTLEESIERVSQMEQYLDEILEKWQDGYRKFGEDEELLAKLEILSEYYSSSLWIEDYDRDCAGEFPKDFKRGVLAQDTLYNLFEELKEYLKDRKVLFLALHS